MNIETRYQGLSQIIKQYAQEPHILRNRYKHTDLNEIDFDCANIINKYISTLTEEKEIGNKEE